jgi:hypothetical protein
MAGLVAMPYYGVTLGGGEVGYVHSTAYHLPDRPEFYSLYDGTPDAKVRADMERVLRAAAELHDRLGGPGPFLAAVKTHVAG